MIDLEQIKADIAARKAMPSWGPQTSIERIRTINATLPSFSLKTVEALVDMLEKSQRANAAQDDHINQQQDRIDQLENAAARLGRRLNQYSMGPVATLDVQSGRSDGNKFALAYSSAAHKLPDDVYFLYCRARPESVVPDDAKLRELFDSWFASDCSFDRSPEASETDNIAWRESYWYVWQRCSTAILSVSQLEGL
ncbi:TPA: hypothetical protein L7M83_001758 [Klebsiella pneumoniae]|nr:hypothetical protein [Klebsiella pneumoniae]HBQ2005264.1 hypothetical protein [Klebsiella pneumoniae]HBQ2014669.1 hypothetical protein [Klebsiella pneumoniae]HBQ2063648.1 hypothetical protein [Klebsiella pneumoniae]HBQ2064369.1 hypothetical protein [Klebsiella pneumoniae]